MIVDRLSNWRQYEALAPLRPAFEYLEQRLGENLGTSRIEIDGDRLFALPQSYRTRPVTDARFETHQRYADVQFIGSGREMIGYAPAEGLQVETPYDPEKDIAFFYQPATWTPVALEEGMFAVFYPEDAHMPCCDLGAGSEVYKVVIKVSIGG